MGGWNVPVVDVIVDDRHPGHPVLGLGVQRREGHVVKQAKTHAPVGRDGIWERVRDLYRRTPRSLSLYSPIPLTNTNPPTHPPSFVEMGDGGRVG